MKTAVITSTLGAFLLALIVGLALLPNISKGDGFIGWPVHLQTATSTTVGPDTVVTLFADDDPADCKTRVISTKDTGIRLSFDDTTGFGSTTLSNTIGHFQGASTTVAYEAGVYGCGLVAALGLSASSTITITEF